MKHSRTALIFFATLLAAAALAVSAQQRGTPAAPASLAADKGRFRILVDGQPAGTEEFEISPNGANWTARAHVETHPQQGAAERFTATLQLRGDGSPLRYEWVSQDAKKKTAVVEFSGKTATLALSVQGGEPFEQSFTFGNDPVVILDNNLYHQYGILARLYDWKTRGTQNFAALIPQDQLPGSVTAEAMGPQDVDGKTYELLRVRTADIAIDCYLDATHRLMRLAVPASKALVVRE